MTMTILAALALSAAALCVWMDHTARRTVAALRARDLLLSRSMARFAAFERRVFGEPRS